MEAPATVRVRLEPAGREIEVREGCELRDVLFGQGVEFPCGGLGRCRGCRVRVVGGEAPVTPEDAARLTESDLAAGWRLGCQLKARPGLTLELAQWEALILADDSRYSFTPRDGLGVAVDVGTTTVVAQLVDRRTARVLGVRSDWNAQARHGADIMSRLEFANRTLDGPAILAGLVRRQVRTMIAELLADQHDPADAAGRLREVSLVGNTVMHHFFCGLPTENLAQHPFEPFDPGLRVFDPASLGWQEPVLPVDCHVRFLPCLGSFVGSDILAGIRATRLDESEAPAALIDLGTNGEIVVGNRDRLLCASTAAGPAFEGARISMGMRAATGAISEVRVVDGDLACHVVGGGRPRGVCGSGLVDAVAAGLELGRVAPSGRLREGQPLRLADPVRLVQSDLRELQLAKGAIAAGLRILARRWGTTTDQLAAVHLAGAFGNYINRTSARRIGLLPLAEDRVAAAGNAALLGAKLDLFREAGEDESYDGLRRRVTHVSLHDDAEFTDVYVAEMSFPDHFR